MKRRNFLFAAAAVAAASQFRILERLGSSDTDSLRSLSQHSDGLAPNTLTDITYSEHLNWVFDDRETPVPLQLIEHAKATASRATVQVPLATQTEWQSSTQQTLVSVGVEKVVKGSESETPQTVIEDGISESLDSKNLSGQPTEVAKSVVDKVKNFSANYSDDVFLNTSDQSLLDSTLNRLSRLQKLTGFGNFNILSFDEALKYAKNFSEIGEFTPLELAFIEQTFSADARNYGFYGEKVSSTLTDVIAKDSVIKIPGSGHYLFKEQSLSHYDKLVSDVGTEIVLTSGIRANVKQLHLFLAKARSVGYNMSRASRSLAPPGHSFHGIGDYDVGKVGMGAANFTDAFADSDVFKRMADLGYIQIRYMPENTLGVRFEPWHIKVV